MTRMPAVIVSHQGHRRIADLSFSCELRFLKVRHPNDRHSPRSINLGLGPCRKRGSLHTQIGAAPVNVDSLEFSAGRGLERVTQVAAYRIPERYMRRNPITEERGDPGTSPVKELIGKHYIHGFETLAQRPHGACGDYSLDPQHLHRVDVGPEWNLGREELVPSSVTRKKRDSQPRK